MSHRADDHRRLHALTTEALELADRLRLWSVAIGLNQALVALDGMGRAPQGAEQAEELTGEPT